VDASVLELEELIVDAWPAAETLDLDGWLLRRNGGPSRRANSVSALQAGRELALDERIARVEAFYREHQQPVLFQIGPCTRPKELDATLAARGYDKVDESAVMIAAPEELTAKAASAFEVRVERTASRVFAELALEQSRFAQTPDVLRGVFQQLGSRVRYLVAYQAGAPCASCYVIASEDRLGVYGMLTRESSRRLGAGRALLHAVAERARAEQLRELYLLVETGNAAARALYAQAGFRDLYTYAYRRCVSGP
jgi:GNAT superfamily N-acetyltransferase